MMPKLWLWLWYIHIYKKDAKVANNKYKSKSQYI